MHSVATLPKTFVGLPAPARAMPGAPRVEDAPRVEIVVPAYNEELALAWSIRRLHEHLERELPFSWRIVIADNASVDKTAIIGRLLAEDLPGVEYMRLAEKGRGRALREAWLKSDADVVCYMDVDLSTDLRALLPLLAPLISGHSDVAIGTRLARGAHVVRGRRRELISRAYNRLLRTAVAARFSDAQCGFKAMRAEVARRLLPDVRDQGWFFDTELLVLAQRSGLRIHEVPVDWVEDPDSRVDVVGTALGDLRGIVRLLAEARLVRFMAIGVVSTVAYALLYLLLRGPLGAAEANALSLAITAVANTQANRRLTFGVRGRERLLRDQAMGALVYVLTLCMTSASLLVLNQVDPTPGRAAELTVLVLASLGATVTRYLGLRFWIFAGRARPSATGHAVTAIGRVGL